MKIKWAKWITAVVTAIACTPAFAIRGYNSSGAMLGQSDAFKCSTGITCSMVGGKLVMTAASFSTGAFTMENGDAISNAVDDTLSFQSDDSDSTIQALGFEGKDAILQLWADQGDDAPDKWSLLSDHTTNSLFFKNNATSVFSLTSAGIITLANGEVIDNATVDDTISFQSDDNDTTVQILGYEAKDAILQLWSDQGDDSADKFSLAASAADVLAIKNNTTALMSFDSSGNVTGGGTGSMSGYIQKQVAATATTITAAQCGSTFYNTTATAINLPSGTAGLIGCRLTFITLNASNYDINPADLDQIVLLTNAAGDSIRNATVGNVVTLQYAATNEWIDLAHIGTWSDIN